MSASGSGASYFAAGYQPNYGSASQPTAAATAAAAAPKVESPKPPKKPLTPYMRFSTSIWQSVKAANPGFSICEIGATIGRMWRELGEEDKQRHMDDFNKDKVRYETELQGYLKSQGLRSLKAKTKKKPEPKPAASPAAPAAQRHQPAAATTVQPPPAHSTQAVSQQQQLAQAFMGLPIAGMSGGLQMAVGMPSAMMGMLGPHFQQQVWAGQQYVNPQQMMQLQLAAQQSSGSASGTTVSAQDLYGAGNGYADVVTSAASKQRSSSDYRYQQSYN